MTKKRHCRGRGEGVAMGGALSEAALLSLSKGYGSAAMKWSAADAAASRQSCEPCTADDPEHISAAAVAARRARRDCTPRIRGEWENDPVYPQRDRTAILLRCSRCVRGLRDREQAGAFQTDQFAGPNSIWRRHWTLPRRFAGLMAKAAADARARGGCEGMAASLTAGA